MVLRWDVNQEDIATALKEAGAPYTYIDRQDYATVLKRLEAADAGGVDHEYIDDQDLSEFINQQGGGFGGSIPVPGLSLDLTLPSTGPSLDCVRASVGYSRNNAGVYSLFAINTPRITDLGLLVEEARTNSIRNNSMQGAVAGTPGTVPTNWAINPSGSGLTREIVGVGVENGIDYIDVKFSGTTSATVDINIRPEGALNQIPASPGQTWTASAFFKLVSGTNPFSAVTFYCGGTNGTVVNADQTFVSVSLSNILTRAIVSRLMSDATTTHVLFYTLFRIQSGTVCNFILRIGWPQLELGAFATSPIRTTSAAVTRAGETVGVVGFTPTFPVTLFAEAMLPVIGASAFPGLAQIYGTDGSTDRAGLNASGASMRASGGITTASASQASLSVVSPLVALGVPFKSAIAIAANDAIMAAGGLLSAPDTSVTLFTPVSLALGRLSVGSNFANGYIKRVAYWPKRLSNAELRVITS